MRAGALCTALLLAAAGMPAQTLEEYRRAWSDPEVEQRIESGIRSHRMGFGTLRFQDRDGQPLTGVEVALRQASHEFLFGANIFMLGGFDTPEKNSLYEERFKQLFNYATAPFYWSDLEPEQGKPRFAADSMPIYRRPPPDAVLDFCGRNGIRVKGHPLIWHAYLPPWLPRERDAIARLIARRFAQIAQRYGDKIPVWDVVNEALVRPGDLALPRDYVHWAFREAGRLFPSTAMLMINEVPSLAWSNFHYEDSPYYLLIQNLLLRGAPVRGIGFQLHLFSEEGYRDVLAGKEQRPLDMIKVLDQYSDFHLPIHITEITIPALPNDAAGRAAQAEVTRNFYRLWFSHASVGAITWWNLADGTALGRENRWSGGLLDENLAPKPSYEALDALINREWRTSLSASSGAASSLKFHGFLGTYQLTARHQGKVVETTVRLSCQGDNRFEIRF